MAFDAPAPLDPERRLEIEAYVALIDATLARRSDLLPGRAATRLLERLTDHGGARLIYFSPTRFRISFLGIITMAIHDAGGLLAAWSEAAKDRLARA